jgi:hypothetical protein
LLRSEVINEVDLDVSGDDMEVLRARAGFVTEILRAGTREP